MGVVLREAMGSYERIHSREIRTGDPFAEFRQAIDDVCKACLKRESGFSLNPLTKLDRKINRWDPLFFGVSRSDSSEGEAKRQSVGETPLYRASCLLERLLPKESPQ